MMSNADAAAPEIPATCARFTAPPALRATARIAAWAEWFSRTHCELTIAWRRNLSNTLHEADRREEDNASHRFDASSFLSSPGYHEHVS